MEFPLKIFNFREYSYIKYYIQCKNFVQITKFSNWLMHELYPHSKWLIDNWCCSTQQVFFDRYSYLNQTQLLHSMQTLSDFNKTQNKDKKTKFCFYWKCLMIIGNPLIIDGSKVNPLTSQLLIHYEDKILEIQSFFKITWLDL